MEGGARPAREESRRLAPGKHGAERMERNTASSAEEARETEEKLQILPLLSWLIKKRITCSAITE